MRLSVRAWGGIALALVGCVGFAHFCVRIVPAGSLKVADAPKVAFHSGPLIIPVEGVSSSALTDTFTQARASGARAHDAIDIMAARGRAVLAARDGTIEKLFWSHDGGRTIYERSPDGRAIFYYAHLDAYAQGLHEGQAIRRGQRIGSVGSTGNADPAAPHLHFAIHAMQAHEPWHGGRAINPYPLLVQER